MSSIKKTAAGLLLALALFFQGPSVDAVHEGYTRIVQAYEQRIVGFARVRLVSLHDSEDVSQETLMRLYESRARFEYGDDPATLPERFESWLFAIERNVIREKYRERSKHSRLRRGSEDFALHKHSSDVPTQAIAAEELSTTLEAIRPQAREVLAAEFLSPEPQIRPEGQREGNARHKRRSRARIAFREMYYLLHA